jgi:hypothetical protein
MAAYLAAGWLSRSQAKALDLPGKISTVEIAPYRGGVPENTPGPVTQAQPCRPSLDVTTLAPNAAQFPWWN